MTDVSESAHRACRRAQVRVVDAPLKSPAATTGLLEVFRRRYLLRLLVRREISSRYQGSVLGLLWSYINPLSQFFIYYVVMGVLFGLHKDVPNFAIHMFCGIIIVHFFTETFNAGTRSIVRNKALVEKMALPREMFPVASMLVSGYHVLPQVVIMIVVCLLLGWTPTMGGFAALVVALLIIALVGTAMALLFSAANVFFRDVGNVASDPDELRALRRADDLPVHADPGEVRRVRAALPAQPDRRRGAALPEGLLGRHHRRPGLLRDQAHPGQPLGVLRHRGRRRVWSCSSSDRWSSPGSRTRSRSASDERHRVDRRRPRRRRPSPCATTARSSR